MDIKPLKPSQLVVEFRSRLRITVRQVNRSNQNSLNSGLNVAGLVVLRISRQARAGKHWSVISRENSYTIPRTLSLPDCFVLNRSKSVCGKGPLLRLQFLKANHIRLGFGQPGHDIVDTLIYIVNVKGRDFHEGLSIRL
jgi:hypothetical protein